MGSIHRLKTTTKQNKNVQMWLKLWSWIIPVTEISIQFFSNSVTDYNCLDFVITVHNNVTPQHCLCHSMNKHRSWLCVAVTMQALDLQTLVPQVYGWGKLAGWWGFRHNKALVTLVVRQRCWVHQAAQRSGGPPGEHWLLQMACRPEGLERP